MNSRNLLGAISEQKPTGPVAIGSTRCAESLDFSSPDQQFSLLDYWRVLLRRRSLILASLLFMLAAAVLVSLRTTRLYRAVGQITINRENPNPLGLKEPPGGGAVDTNGDAIDLATQVKILQSNSLVSQVIRKLVGGNEQSSGSTSIADNPNPSLTPPPQNSNPQRARLLGVYSVAVLPDTRIVEISYSSADPRFAADAVNTLINTYIEQNLQTRFASTTQAADWLTKQLSELQIKVEISEAKLVRYQKEHGIVGTDEKQNIITSKLDDLNKELTTAEADRIQKQALYELMLSNDPEEIGVVTQDTVLQSLRGQQADLKGQLAQSAVQLGPAYPKVVELKNRLQQMDATIDAELKRTTSRVHNDYVAALAREKMLRQALDQQKLDANQLGQNAIEYNLLKRDADSNRQLYDSLLQKLKEAGLSAGLSSTNVHIVDLASPPRHPFKPDIPRNLAIGFLLGLTSGVALAFVLEAMDNTVCTPEQAEAVACLPSLAIIPFENGLFCHAKNDQRVLASGRQNEGAAVDVIAYTWPNSGMAEAHRALRTAILLSLPGAAPKVIVVTSPLPKEGKTATCINSAIVLAQEGRRVLLVDADLRRPSIHGRLRINAARGLTTLLTGNTVPESVFIPSPQLPNLWVLPAGPVSPNPSELLSSSRMKHLLREWGAIFDHVILDLPPVLPVTDAVRLSHEAHAVILVVRSGQTSKAALRRAIALLAQVNANVIGIVVNALDFKSSDQYYYYYSGSGYGGYSEADQAEKASA